MNIDSNNQNDLKEFLEQENKVNSLKFNHRKFSQLNLFSQINQEESQEFERFYEPEKYIITNSNILVASYLSNLANWRTDKICLLHGPHWSGKSHLCWIAHQKNVNSILINKYNMDLISKYDILQTKNFIILDDLDFFSEEVVFHFFNYIRFSDKFLLLSARNEFLENVKLKDLSSRLCSVPNFHLNQIDENLMRGIIIKIMSDFDILFKESQLKFICFNLERSFEAIFNFVQKIKRYILENSGKITLNVLKRIIFNDDPYF